MSLPIDRTTKSVLDANLVNGVLSDGPTIKASTDVVYNTIDELNQKVDGLVGATTLSPYPPAQYNKLINGNFDVWQRATSLVNGISNSFVADRFYTTANAGTSGAFPANITVLRQTLTSGDIAQANYFLRVNPDGAGTQSTVDSFYTIRQSIENGTRYLCGAGKKVTVSFWARSNIANKKMAINLKQNYGLGGAPSAQEELVGQTFSLTNVWTKYTATFTTNTLVGKTFGTQNDDQLTLLFWYEWGSTFISRINAAGSEGFVGVGTIDIAQVQLCAGDVAIPFQPSSFGEELARCQRFYQTFGIGTGGIINAATTINLKLRFPVIMRIAPTVTTLVGSYQIYDGTSVLTASSGIFTSGTSSASGSTINGTGFTGLTTYRPMVLVTDNAGGLDAEL